MIDGFRLTSPEPVRLRRIAHWCRYYSGMGTYALKRGKTLRQRILAWIAALLGSTRARLAGPLAPGGLDLVRLKEMMSEGFACSVEKAEQRLTFRASIDLSAGLRATALWYRAQAWLA